MGVLQARKLSLSVVYAGGDDGEEIGFDERDGPPGPGSAILKACPFYLFDEAGLTSRLLGDEWLGKQRMIRRLKAICRQLR